MADLALGLDIGCNSIGWALVDESAGNIVATGVRAFSEGVDRDPQGGEKSKGQARRTARLMRRQLARRAARKRHLREVLTPLGLLPTNPVAFQELMSMNPYPLRSRALDERLEPYEIGRVLLNLNQRRGFLSTRKTNQNADSETKGMLREIGELASAIQAAGCRTLGEHLATLDQNFSHTQSSLNEKVRSRHTRRAMIEEEFEAIWESQAKHYPQLLTDKLKYGRQGRQVYPKKPTGNGTNRAEQVGVHGLLFLQRPTYWPKSVVGHCELEPKLKRCPKADRAAQRFRILQEVNNLRLIDRASRQQRALSPDERTKLVDYLVEAKERTFDQIRKKLEFTDTQAVRFNLESNRDKLKGNETDAILANKKFLGKRWHGLDEDVKNAIVTILIEEDNPDEALVRLQQRGLTADEAERASNADLVEGYASLSRVAICKLLPHLERGLPLMGNDASDSALHAAGYLRPDERHVRQRDLLPAVPGLPNPIVRQALYEVRKVVN